jgi:hypothetical protein
MAVIVKSSIKITKGFDTWQKMVKSQDEKLKELGIVRRQDFWNH